MRVNVGESERKRIERNNKILRGGERGKKWEGVNVCVWERERGMEGELEKVRVKE